MHRKTFFLTIVLLLSIEVGAQNRLKFEQTEKAIPFEKLYVQTDREFYFVGDTLWFAAYNLDAATHIPSKINCNLYVELIDESGDFVQTDFFVLNHGFCSGYISLDGESLQLQDGNYLLRAYTDFLKPFGDETFFTKAIRVLKSKNSNIDVFTEKIGKELQNVELGFYPEGGFILEGVMNHVAFQVTDENGQVIEAKGELLDNYGNKVLEFETQYKGSGRFLFLPEKDKKYIAKVDGFDKQFEIPRVRQDGAKLMLGYNGGENLNLGILTNKVLDNQQYYIAVLYRGEAVTLIKLDEQHIKKSIQVQKEYLNPGINRFVLLDRNMEPVSERLAFVDFDDSVELELSLNSTSFETRQKVDLKFDLPSEVVDDGFTRLSVSVVSEDALNASGVTQNIKSYLLLDSELKGYISSPLDYFVDGEELSSQQKLDLLMLTHGWRNYLWNNIREEDVEFIPEPLLGFDFGGVVKTSNERKMITNSEVMLSVGTAEQSFIAYNNTNQNGEFLFKNVIFHDTALVILQGKNEKDKLKTTISLNDLDFGHSALGNQSKVMLKSFIDVPVSAFKAKYFNDLALSEFYPGRNNELLAPVDIIGKRKVEIGDNFNIHGTPDYMLTVRENDVYYDNIFQYIAGRVPGVKVFNESIIIRGVNSFLASSEPLYLIDGVTADKGLISMIPMSNIDKIEVLKSNSAAVYGSRGANGVVAIYTRVDKSSPGVSLPALGTVVKKIKGFTPYLEFYSPEYNAENIESEKPDFRTTLYWNPSFDLSEKNKTLSFFTCDNLSNYKIFVEGITSDGRVCLGETEFVVDKHKRP